MTVGDPTIRDWSGEATRHHAVDVDCGCAGKRPQCPYHQGMEDGMDSVGNLLVDGVITPADLGLSPRVLRSQDPAAPSVVLWALPT